MGYNSGPSGKTDNPILKSTQEIKEKGAWPAVSSNGSRTGVQGMCQRLDTKEEESRGKRKGTF